MFIKILDIEGQTHLVNVAHIIRASEVKDKDYACIELIGGGWINTNTTLGETSDQTQK